MTFKQRLSADYYARVHRDIRARMAEAGIDVLLLDSNDDVIYTTGFSHYTTERPVVFALTQDKALLLIPELERTHCAKQHVAAEPVVYFEFPGIDKPFDVLARALGNVTGTIGHSAGISMARAPQIAAAFPNAKVKPSGIVSTMRLTKYPEEIVLQQEAARISDSMVAAGVAMISEAFHSGRLMPTEIEVESHIMRHALDVMNTEHEDIMFVQGISGGLVYGGLNSAYPHGMPSARRFEKGESFMLSLGCRVGGRAAESERTFILGEPSADQARFYTVAYEAQKMATEALIAGKTCASADNLALAYIRDSGMGEYCLHRVGHGMGVMFHEPPWVEGGDQTVLLPNMVCSTEPALYVPGLGGFRIADTVHVTETGPNSLTKYPRKLEEIVIA
ncbi:Aminopeptidase YpdF (MP-, MA-, MS-, AP-, NP-speci fic) [Devosia sp. DBB001]|nr:Aminopeptidase YpdF (MP-, MA-, MS-, AP-, NP-speci fic) [Devosia sp. DBB001]